MTLWLHWQIGCVNRGKKCEMEKPAAAVGCCEKFKRTTDWLGSDTVKHSAARCPCHYNTAHFVPFPVSKCDVPTPHHTASVTTCIPLLWNVKYNSPKSMFKYLLLTIWNCFTEKTTWKWEKHGDLTHKQCKYFRGRANTNNSTLAKSHIFDANN